MNEALKILTCDFFEYLQILGKNTIKNYYLTKSTENEKSYLIRFTDGNIAKIKVIVKE